VILRIVEILEEDEEQGMRANELAGRMNMNVNILEPFLNNALRNGKIAVDRQDIMGEKYYPNSILFWKL
jgi:predicted transcriptional regulator